MCAQLLSLKTKMCSRVSGRWKCWTQTSTAIPRHVSHDFLIRTQAFPGASLGRWIPGTTGLRHLTIPTAPSSLHFHCSFFFPLADSASLSTNHLLYIPPLQHLILVAVIANPTISKTHFTKTSALVGSSTNYESRQPFSVRRTSYWPKPIEERVW